MFKKKIQPNAWKDLVAITTLKNAYLNNIKSPIHVTAEELNRLELGFAEMTDFKHDGTIAAGDGIVFRMQMPTNEQVDGDVTSYYTRKGYYAYGLQVSLIIAAAIFSFLLKSWFISVFLSRLFVTHTAVL